MKKRNDSKKDVTRMAVMLASVFLLCLTVNARTVQATEMNLFINQNKKVSLNLKEATVKEFFDIIHQQTGLDFIYNTEQMATMPLITITVHDISVEEALERVFNNKGFDFKRNGTMIIVSKQNNIDTRRLNPQKEVKKNDHRHSLV